jgi:hypothetical protein
MFFIHYHGHDVHAGPQITKCVLIVLIEDGVVDHGHPRIFLNSCYQAIPSVILWGIVPSCMVSAGSPPRMVAHPVDTIFAVSTGDSGYPGIFPDSKAGTAAAI